MVAALVFCIGPTDSLTPCSRILEKLIVPQLVTKFPECSLPYSRERTSLPYPKAVQLYIEATDSSYMHGGDDGQNGCPVSAYCCVPVTPVTCSMSATPKDFLPAKGISASIRGNVEARRSVACK